MIMATKNTTTKNTTTRLRPHRTRQRKPPRTLPGRLSSCAPSMGADLEVQVLPQVVHNEGREAQGRKGDRPSEGSVERIREPMNKNGIRGGAVRGEQARSCEAAMDKGLWRKSRGCAEKVGVLTCGDLALRLKGRRVHDAERGVSRGHSRSRRQTPPKGRTKGRAEGPGVST